MGVPQLLHDAREARSLGLGLQVGESEGLGSQHGLGLSVSTSGRDVPGPLDVTPLRAFVNTLFHGRWWDISLSESAQGALLAFLRAWWDVPRKVARNLAGAT